MRGKPGREVGQATGAVRYNSYSVPEPVTDMPGHRVSALVGKPDADAFDFGVDPEGFNVLFGVAILRYCDVPGPGPRRSAGFADAVAVNRRL